ncbi:MULTISPECIES: hypothetical protein [unclassified Akkermansia]|uniref:hypothetical protein n=1 Tax=unclassified Akkermansia TaxID=2608915 RepID=UPI0011C92F46|nr:MULTISPECIES: hypothetical protein [unclassified Akkermansia]
MEPEGLAPAGIQKNSRPGKLFTGKSGLFRNGGNDAGRAALRQNVQHGSMIRTHRQSAAGDKKSGNQTLKMLEDNLMHGADKDIHLRIFHPQKYEANRDAKENKEYLAKNQHMAPSRSHAYPVFCFFSGSARKRTMGRWHAQSARNTRGRHHFRRKGQYAAAEIPEPGRMFLSWQVCRQDGPYQRERKFKGDQKRRSNRGVCP